MTASDSPARPSTDYRERLAPGPWMFIGLLLIIPAVMLTVTPIAVSFAIPTSIGVYVVIAGTLLFFAPVVTVQDGVLTAGRARIPVTLLGEVELLDSEGLRIAIGPGMDARSHLMVRGYIHAGVRVEVIDPEDPTPSWIITTRRPTALRQAILTARAEATPAA